MGRQGVAGSKERCQTLVFFHVPKTGGESLNLVMTPRYRGKAGTVAHHWKKYNCISIRVNMKRIQVQKGALLSIKPWKEDWRKERGSHTLVELHCGTSMSLVQAEETLARMRADHEINGCGFFAFTIIRDPLEWVVSLYDDICHRRLHGHKESCPQRTPQLTPQEEMTQYPHLDGISSYLFHGWDGWNNKGPMDEEKLQRVGDVMEYGLDMVAFTPEVPDVIHFLTSTYASEGGSLSDAEVQSIYSNRLRMNTNMHKVVKLEDFSPSQVAALNSTVQHDWKLYQRFIGKTRPWQE
ncbi:unnamed protein product [Discosporangium mesarthrocarpum]